MTTLTIAAMILVITFCGALVLRASVRELREDTAGPAPVPTAPEAEEPFHPAVYYPPPEPPPPAPVRVAMGPIIGAILLANLITAVIGGILYAMLMPTRY